MPLRFYYILVYTFVVNFSAYSEISQFKIEKTGVAYFKHYGFEEGLSQLIVKCLAQDEEGNIWLGTSSGVVVFNGYSFTQIIDSNGHNLGHIKKISTGEDGSVAILTSEKNLYILSKNTSTPILLSVDQVVRDIVWSEHDQKWLIATSKQIFLLNNNKSHTIARKFRFFLENESVSKIKRLHDGFILIASNRILKMNHRFQLTHEKLLPNAGINTCLIYDDNIILGYQNKRIIMLDSILTKKFEVLHQASVFDLAYYNDELWTCTSGGIVKWKIDTNSLVAQYIIDTRYNTCSFNADAASCALIDKQNQLWIGSDDGLYKLANHGLTYTPIVNKELLSSKSKYNSILKLQNGNVWLGSNRLGLFDKDGNNYINENNYFFGVGNTNVITSMCYYNDAIYYTTWGNGLCSFNPKTKEFFWHHENKELTKSYFSSSLNQYHNQLFFTNFSGLILSIFDGDVTSLDHKDLYKESFCGDPSLGVSLSINNDTALIGFARNKGLARYILSTGEYQVFCPEKSFSNVENFGAIVEINKSINSCVYLSTTTGIYKWNQNKNHINKVFTDNIISKHSAKIINNDLFVFQNKSLYVYHKDRIILKSKVLTLPKYRATSSFFHDSIANELLIAAEEGYYTIPLGEIEPDTIQPHLKLLRYETGGLNMEFQNSNIAINQKQRSITLQLASNDLRAPEHLKYRYRLNGGMWIDIPVLSNKTPNFQLSNLPPGQNQLEIQVSNLLGEFGGHSREFQLMVEPFWHETTLGRIGIYSSIPISLLLLSLGIITGLRRQVKAKTRALEQELQKNKHLLSEIHHRVKNNLAYIKSLLNLQSMRMLDQGTQAALRDSQSRIIAMALVHNVIYDEKAFEKVELAIYLPKLLESLQSAYDVEKQVALDKQIDECACDMDTAIALGIVITECVTNAYKYAFGEVANPQLLVKLTCTEQQLEVTIKDNGKGFDQSFEPRKTHTLGMQLIFGLVEEQLKGKVELHSNKGLSWKMSIHQFNLK